MSYSADTTKPRDKAELKMSATRESSPDSRTPARTRPADRASAATASVTAFVEAAAPEAAVAAAAAREGAVRRPVSAVPEAIRELIGATASVFKAGACTDDQLARQFDDRFLKQNGDSEPRLDQNGDSVPTAVAAADTVFAAAVAASSEADLAAAAAELAAAGENDEWDEPGAEVPAVSRKITPRIRTRRTRPRSKTIALKRLTRVELQRGAIANPPVEDAERPTTRSDCRDAPRPCPWVACKHHLYLDINPRTGSIKINFPDLEPWELQHTCALDVADNGGLTLEEIGLITNLTRERVRQLEVRGLITLRTRSNSLR